MYRRVNKMAVGLALNVFVYVWWNGFGGPTMSRIGGMRAEFAILVVSQPEVQPETRHILFAGFLSNLLAAIEDATRTAAGSTYACCKRSSSSEQQSGVYVSGIKLLTIAPGDTAVGTGGRNNFNTVIYTINKNDIDVFTSSRRRRLFYLLFTDDDVIDVGMDIYLLVVIACTLLLIDIGDFVTTLCFHLMSLLITVLRVCEFIQCFYYYRRNDVAGSCLYVAVLVYVSAVYRYRLRFGFLVRCLFIDLQTYLTTLGLLELILVYSHLHPAHHEVHPFVLIRAIVLLRISRR